MKRYIVGMSIPKAKAEQRLDHYSRMMSEHLVKCVIYPSSDSYNHWIEDGLASWLSKSNEYTVKPLNRKLSASSYIDHLFGYLGEDRNDAKILLTDFQIDNQYADLKYPEFELSNQLINTMYAVCNAMVTTVASTLSTKNDRTKKDWEVYLHQILDPICK